MKIKLISPLTQGGLLGMRVPVSFLNSRYGGVPLALPTIAGLTPEDVDMTITDENIEKINFRERVDLVGITFNVAGVIRAYQIADEYRKRGVIVILGGVYTSMLPQEAAQHADAIVIGEAENVWRDLIQDFKNGSLKKIYQSNQFGDLKNSPIPRWDLLKSKFYNYHSLQTTRGCPFDCDYCSVTHLFGGTYRHKPVENVIKEIEFLKKIDKNKLIFFVDDNISSNRTYAKDLFSALIPLDIRWYSQVPITIANDGELLELMYKSGCRELFIGFESLSQDSLDAMGKGKINKVAEYEAAIEKIYSYGISIFGSFMLGGEYDSKEIFDKTAQFIDKNNLAFSLINIVVPPPGTRLFQKLENEGRVLHRDWSKYTGEYVVFKPNLITPQRLQMGFIEILAKIYNYDALYKRLRLWWNVISKYRRKQFSFDKFFLKLFISLSYIVKLNDFSKVKYILKALWCSKNLPISILMLSLYCHDYTKEMKNATL